MKIIALLFSLVVTTLAACSYHFYTKEEVIKRVKKGDYRKGENVVMQDNGSIVKVMVRDSNYQQLDEVYHFDENGKQLQYTLIASCDSCFGKYLMKNLTNKGCKWNKINDSTYLSKHSLGSVLTIRKSTHSYTISKQDHR